MDLNLIWQTVSHNPIVAFSAGLALANARTILHYAVLGVFKIPVLRAWLVGNPVQAKSDLAIFVAEVDADIDALVAEHAAATLPASS